MKRSRRRPLFGSLFLLSIVSWIVTHNLLVLYSASVALSSELKEGPLEKDEAAIAEGAVFTPLQSNSRHEEQYNNSSILFEKWQRSIANTATLESPVIMVEIHVGIGRMGNHMWQYASTLGLYRRFRREHPEKRIYACLRARRSSLMSTFEGPFPRRCPAAPSSSSRRVHTEAAFGKYTHFNLLEPCPSGGVSYCRHVFEMYLQSFRYFSDDQDVVRRSFRFRSSVLDKARASWQSLGIPDKITVVGIHVRRGDVAEDSHLVLTPAGFYQRAMAYFQSMYSEVQFVVASDDKEWCKTEPVFKDTILLPDGLDGPTEMAMLTHAEHTIIGAGTFAWWSAWLTGGNVVYFSKQFLPDHPRTKGRYNTSEIFPQHWVGME